MSSSAIASEHGYDMAFVGHITAVDVRRGNVRIAAGPTETTGAGIFLYVMPRKALRQLHQGMDVYVQADTRRRPWRIIHLRPFRRFPKKGRTISEIGLLAASRGAGGTRL